MEVESILAILLGCITAIIACLAKFRKMISTYTFGSGLVAGDSFQRLSPRAIKKRQLEQRRRKLAGGLLRRALSTEFGRQAVAMTDDGLNKAKGRLGDELFRSRSDLRLSMTSLSEVGLLSVDTAACELAAASLVNANAPADGPFVALCCLSHGRPLPLPRCILMRPAAPRCVSLRFFFLFFCARVRRLPGRARSPDRPRAAGAARSRRGARQL